ncbi:ROK family protein [Cohnella hongkongensis]|uniref:ROK family protein n=1 Tax=Cohnella hongkongensis TaxID=178337 RepID=A0ABV9F716_9BACL
MSGCWIGLDVGGTGIKGAIVDEKGGVLVQEKVGTSAADGAEAIFGQLVRVAGKLRDSGLNVSGIGIGSAGRIDRATGTVRYATDNLPGWTGMRLAERIGDAFGLPVYVDNDANAAAAGEGWIGAAAGLRDYALITLGTGVGGALVCGGRVLSGRSGAAGEIGHACLYPGGLPCSCGGTGCVEQYVSGTALNRIARGVSPSWDSYRLLQAFEEGREEAREAMEGFFRDLSLTIRAVQMFMDPEAVVIGGGLADASAVWWEAFQQRWEAEQPYPMPVCPAALGNRAGVIGAARIAMVGGFDDGKP